MMMTIEEPEGGAILIASIAHYVKAWSSAPESLKQAFSQLPKRADRKRLGRPPTTQESEIATRLWDAVYAEAFREQIDWCKTNGISIHCLLPVDQTIIDDLLAEGEEAEYIGERVALMGLDGDDPYRFVARWGDPCRV
jgi:hypothetical protein